MRPIKERVVELALHDRAVRLALRYDRSKKTITALARLTMTLLTARRLANRWCNVFQALPLPSQQPHRADHLTEPDALHP